MISNRGYIVKGMDNLVEQANRSNDSNELSKKSGEKWKGNSSID